MAGWNRLPDELWRIILATFDSKEDASTVRALRATNRHLHALLQPIFRCEIKFRYVYDEKRIERQLQQRIWKLAKDLNIAVIVNSLEMDRVAWNDTKPFESGCQEPIDVYNSCLAKSGISPGFAQDIITGLKQQSREAYLAFMMVICPNLDSLHLWNFDMSANAEALHDKVLHQATASARRACLGGNLSVTPLQKIKSLTLSNPQQTGLKNALQLLTMPNLTYFNAGGVGDTDWHWDHHVPPPLQEPYRNANAIELVLNDTMLSGKGLGCLLESCVQPRALSIRWRAGLWNEHFKNESIGWAIRRFGQTLEYLHLDSTDVCQYSPISEKDIGCFGTFQALTKLKTLAVPGYAFWIPPRSFQYLDEARDYIDSDDTSEDGEDGEDGGSDAFSDGNDTDEEEASRGVGSEVEDDAEAAPNGGEEASSNAGGGGLVSSVNETKNSTEDYEGDHAVNEALSDSIGRNGQLISDLQRSSIDQEVNEEISDEASDEIPEEGAEQLPTSDAQDLSSDRDEQQILEAYPSSPGLPAESDGNASDVLELNMMPPSLERVYILGTYPDHYVYRPNSRYFSYMPFIYDCELEALRLQLSRNRSDSQSPLKIKTVPWLHFYVEEHFGKLFHRHVDYNQLTQAQWPEQRLKCDPAPGDGNIEVY